MTENDMPDDKPYIPRKDRRTSRLVKAEERRRAAKAKDQRFYAMMFSVTGIMIAVVFGIAFLIMYGSTVNVTGLETVTEPWIRGASKLEVGGLVVVALIGVFMWVRMKKR